MLILRPVVGLIPFGLLKVDRSAHVKFSLPLIKRQRRKPQSRRRSER